jgi:hypothetical protein
MSSSSAVGKRTRIVRPAPTQGVEPPRSHDPSAFLADEEKKFERLVRETGVTMEQ